MVLLTQMPSASDYGSILTSFAPLILLFVVFWFFLIRPQRKRDKAEKEMRNSIQIGDEISTIGGFIGKVVSNKDDVIVIESSADRTKLKLYRWAIRGKEAASGGKGRRAETVISSRTAEYFVLEHLGFWQEGIYEKSRKYPHRPDLGLSGPVWPGRYLDPHGGRIVRGLKRKSRSGTGAHADARLLGDR